MGSARNSSSKTENRPARRDSTSADVYKRQVEGGGLFEHYAGSGVRHFIRPDRIQRKRQRPTLHFGIGLPIHQRQHFFQRDGIVFLQTEQRGEPDPGARILEPLAAPLHRSEIAQGLPARVKDQPVGLIFQRRHDGSGK